MYYANMSSSNNSDVESIEEIKRGHSLSFSDHEAQSYHKHRNDSGNFTDHEHHSHNNLQRSYSQHESRATYRHGVQGSNNYTDFDIRVVRSHGNGSGKYSDHNGGSHHRNERSNSNFSNHDYHVNPRHLKNSGSFSDHSRSHHHYERSISNLSEKSLHVPQKKLVPALYSIYRSRSPRPTHRSRALQRSHSHRSSHSHLPNGKAPRPSHGQTMSYTPPTSPQTQMRSHSPPPRSLYSTKMNNPSHSPQRWVGVHGSPAVEGSDGTSTTPLLTSSTPNSPQTPHIVVSPEDQANANNNIEIQDRKNLASPPGPPQNGPYDQFSGNPSSNQAPPPTPAPIDEKRKERERHPSISKPERPDRLPLQRSLDLPDDSPYPKTRQNTVKELMRRHSGDAGYNQYSPSGGNGESYLNIPRSISRNSLSPSVVEWKSQGNDSLIACLSALYGKLLVVMGMAFPMAEVISTEKVPFSFYIGFYLYLYIGSILFLVYVYLFLLRTTTIPPPIKSKFRSLKNFIPTDLSWRPKVLKCGDTDSQVSDNVSKSQSWQTQSEEWNGKQLSWINVIPVKQEYGALEKTKLNSRMASKDSRLSACSDAEADRASMATTFKTQNYKYSYSENNNHGSMYLKMGAVLFGIGSMIYSGLEVGQFFELQADSDCANILLAISPAASMLFTFIQMYFIFLNSRVAINKHRIMVRFGLMHMIGTNLCNWLNVLVKETKHEIDTLTLGHHGHGSSSGELDSDSNESVLSGSEEDFSDSHSSSAEYTTPKPIHDVLNPTHNLVKRSTGHQAYSVYDCRRSDLMGKLVDNASPFLFPCTIEYSLLCAGVLFVIWRNSTKPVVNLYDNGSDISNYVARKARHHYSVDCAHASRGLFMGILVLVLTIISLILFFVLIDNEELKKIAVLEANIIELSLYSVAIITAIIGMIQMRELEFIPEGDVELDNILLLIAQTGVFVYASFTVIGSHFQTGVGMSELLLPLITAIVTLTQTTVQTIFVLDASRRCCYTQDQLTRKPGREMVTFLLVCNLAMWAINTFETSRADAHPKQLEFYGIWAWTIISHISMPLAIFYRFHVTVCLCEIWKRSYKLKHEFM